MVSALTGSLVFASLGTLAFYLLYIQQASIGLDQAFEPHCPATGGAGIGIAAYRKYIGAHVLDYFMCMLVNVFTIALNPPMRAVNAPFFLSLPTAWLVLLIETASHFPTRPMLVIVISFVWGIWAQLLGGGIAFPIVFAFAQFARWKRRAKNLPVGAPSNAVTKGIMFAMVLGVIPITVLLVLNPTPTTIALWQPFPLCVVAIQTMLLLWHWLVSNKPMHLSSNPLTHLRHLLLITAAIPVPWHFMFLLTILSSPTPLRMLADFLFPYPFEFHYQSVEELMALGLPGEAKRFLQWDALFIYASIWLGGAWSWAFSSLQTFRRALGISLLGGAFFGPGVLMAYPYYVQLQRDEDERALSLSQAKKQKN